VPERDPLLSRQPVAPDGVRRGVWAGIGSEVAALTGAEASRPRYAPPSRSSREPGPQVAGRLSRDASFTRDELLQIHAGIKEL
jgi:hypothetical protein